MKGKATRAAWQSGYDAYLSGTDESKNPYPTTDDRHLSWNDGWAEAAKDNEGEGA